MRIRKARRTDAELVWKAHTASIRHFCSAAYAPDLIDEWVGILAPDRYVEAIETLEFVVAEEAGQVQGFCILDLQTGELHAMYVSPAAAGHRLGRTLLTWAEDTARRHGRIALFLKSTLNAVAFYEKCGFQRGPLTNQPLPSGTPRACVEMRKALGQSDRRRSDPGPA